MTKATLSARDRILGAAVDLLAREGASAVSTRAVSAAADVQAPAIYRQFGDMKGLLEEAARETLRVYVRQKVKRSRSEDPLEDLRRGWDEHVAFGLANPDAYALLYTAPSTTSDPASREGMAVLEGLLTRVAETGKLQMSVEAAAQLIHAGAKGVVLSLIGAKEAQRDLRLSTSMRDVLVAAITDAAPKASRSTKRVAPRAVALRAVLPEARSVSPGERLLLDELLARLAASDD